MINLKPTDLIAVTVPPDCYDQKIITLGSTMANIILRWKEGKCKHHADTPDIFDDFIDLPENRGGYALLGTVTEKDIDFDPSGYLKMGGLGTFKNYAYTYKSTDGAGIIDALQELKSLKFRTANESFYSLLKANGLHFVNPPVKAYEQGKVPLSAQIQPIPLVKKILILKPI